MLGFPASPFPAGCDPEGWAEGGPEGREGTEGPGVGNPGDGKDGDEDGDGREGDGREGDGREGDGREGDGKEGEDGEPLLGIGMELELLCRWGCGKLTTQPANAKLSVTTSTPATAGVLAQATAPPGGCAGAALADVSQFNGLRFGSMIVQSVPW